MSDIDAAIGGRIREARKTAGVTLDEIAKRFGCTRAAVGHWESGRRGLAADRVAAIAEAVHADPCWILTGKTSSPVESNAHRIKAAAGALAVVAGVLDDLMRGRL